MSGTRLNSAGGSRLVVDGVTKEQMSDFAMLDINDVFLYEASTEGTGTYTEFSIDRNGSPVDGTSLDPNGANRLRGVGPANISFGNFETSGRVPLDPINIDAVEISRGPIRRSSARQRRRKVQRRPPPTSAAIVSGDPRGRLADIARVWI
jgi:hypothetical protein